MRYLLELQSFEKTKKWCAMAINNDISEMEERCLKCSEWRLLGL